MVNIQNISLCDPFQSKIFWDTYVIAKTESDCSYCLPDCVHTSYQPIISVEPFRSCDEKNFEISDLCNIQNSNLEAPVLFGTPEVYTAMSKSIVYKERLSSYLNKSRTRVNYFPNRELASSLNQNIVYDAFSKDIGLASFFFHTTTILEFRTDLSQTWIFFLSNAAGIFGLFIGITLTTIFEIIWLLRILI